MQSAPDGAHMLHQVRVEATPAAVYALIGQVGRWWSGEHSYSGDAGNLARLGFNHVCLAVDDLEGAVARLRANGVRTRNEMMVFHDRKLIFLRGPEGVTVELAEWIRS